MNIDVGSSRTARELHEALSSALGFPSWYGHNWDAFDEAIAELVELPAEIRFLGWSKLQQRLPHDAGKLRELLSDLQNERPGSAPTVQFND